MNHKFFLGIFYMVLCVGLGACQDSENIGADIVDGGALINSTFTDTLTLEVELERRDPTTMTLAQVPTNQGARFLLGRLDDPIFGKSAASICTQLTTAENDVRFGRPSLDSVVLTLTYPSVGNRFEYGDTEQELAVTVYEIDETLSNDEEYDSDYQCTLKEGEDGILGTASRLISTDIDTSENNELYRIRIKDEFGQRLLDESLKDRDENNVFFNVTNFLEHFNGIAIVPDENNKALTRFNLASSRTRMEIHYKDTIELDTGVDTITTQVRYLRLRNWANILGTTINHFEHDYAGSEVEALIGERLTDKAYIQSMAGVNLRVRIPYLKNLGNVIVNKAELEVVNVDTTDQDLFPLPGSLLFRLARGEGQDDLLDLQDYIVSNPFFIDSVDNGDVVRRCNLFMTYAIQGMLAEDDLSLIVRQSETPLNPLRATLAGPEAEAYPMRLKLYYTEIP